MVAPQLTYVLIAAGGMGSRMQTTTPKQYLLIHGKPLLYYTVTQFVAALPSVHIVLIVPSNYVTATELLINTYFSTIPISVVVGGNTRYQSVANGMAIVPLTAQVVMVHDAARCMVSTTLITNCYQHTIAYGNAVPCVPVVDSLRKITTNNSEVLNRDTIRAVQTPQCFTALVLHKAMQQPYLPSFTDEATAVQQLGYDIQLISGDAHNIKITTPLDIQIATLLLA